MIFLRQLSFWKQKHQDTVHSCLLTGVHYQLQLLLLVIVVTVLTLSLYKPKWPSYRLLLHFSLNMRVNRDSVMCQKTMKKPVFQSLLSLKQQPVLCQDQQDVRCLIIHYPPNVSPFFHYS